MSTVYGQFFVGDRQEIVAYLRSCRVVHNSKDSSVLILDRSQKTTMKFHANLYSVSNVAHKACIISGLVLQFFNAVTKSHAEGPRPYFTKVNNCCRIITWPLGDLLSEVHKERNQKSICTYRTFKGNSALWTGRREQKPWKIERDFFTYNRSGFLVQETLRNPKVPFQGWKSCIWPLEWFWILAKAKS